LKYSNKGNKLADEFFKLNLSSSERTSITTDASPKINMQQTQ
jgi:hypothetical protein